MIFLVATGAGPLCADHRDILATRMIQAGVVLRHGAVSRAIVRDMVSTDKAASMIGYVTMWIALAR